MAGIGSAWGTREEMLHPRDRFGRFRKKWKMAAGVVDALTGFLDRFQPRQFQSDQQASQYAFNSRKQPWTTPELQRLHMDWDDANESLQAGEMDDTTKKFVEMMDRNMVETTDDLIVSVTVPTTAFGLTPQQAALEDGGLEDLIGLEIADAGYLAANLGSELSHPPGSATLRIATPKGTRVAFGGRSPGDRGLAFDRDQPLVITKVESDGRGGYYMLAIAGSGARTKGATAVADDRTHGRRGGGLTPEQREARVSPQMSGEERLRIAQQNAREMETGPSAVTPAPGATQTPAPEPAPTPAPVAPASPQAPGTPAAGVPERREPVQSEAVGPGSPEGKSPSDIATEAEAARIEAENAPPAPPAPPSPAEFRAATAELPSPAAGPRRSQWNKAHQGIVTGKRDPGDVLRELDTDVAVAKQRKDRIGRGEDPPDPNLDSDIEAMDKLADSISEQYGVPRRGQTSAPAKAAPAPAAPAPAKAAKKAAGPKPTPGAPSTTKEATPKAPAPRAVKRAPQEIADSFKTVKSKEEGDALLQNLTGPELQAVAEAAGISVPKRATKDKLRQTIGQHGYGRRLDGDAIRDSSTRQRQEAGTLTDGQKARIVDRAKGLRGKEANDEDRRIVAMADEIEAGGTGEVAAKKALDQQQVAEKALAKKAPAKKAAKAAKKVNPNLAGLSDEDLTKITESDQFRDDQKDAIRQEQAARVAKKAVPAKAVAKKAVPAKAAPSPVDADEEAFKARVAEAGLPDRVTALQDMARTQKIRGFSTMNKRQLQSALLGDEVPRAGKIGVVPPARMVPHLQAADSDQAARALLSNHTLKDLRDLAKERELKLPSRGVTKARVTDMVLEDIRGPQEGIQGRTPDTGLEEDLANLGYISLPGANGDAINREIDQTQPDSPEALRQHRDNLEALSKQFRKDGDKNAANMAQAAADAMGMRAQTISGVEEVAPPVKRVAKKAVPEAPEGEEEAPETERPLEKMLKPELLSLAQREGASVRPAWTKAKILDEIKKNRRMGTARDAGESEEDRLRRELGGLPGGPERDLGPTQGPLRLPDRAPTAEEIARDNPDLDIQKMFNDSGLPHDPGGMVSEAQHRLTEKDGGPKAAADFLRRESEGMIKRIPNARKFEAGRAGGALEERQDAVEAQIRDEAQKVLDIADKIEATPAPVKKVTKKAAKKAVADVDRAAATVSGDLKGTFGDQLRQTDAEELRQAVREAGLGDIEGKTAEEIFDNTIKKALEDRMRELGMLPDDPAKPTKAQKRVPKGSVKGPKADVPIATEDRRRNFIDAWNQQPGFTDDESMVEIRDRIADGEFTHEEGVRRIESEIGFNEEEISDLGAELRGLAPEDRDDATAIHARRTELQDTITAQKKAIKFLRDYAKDEAPVTREDLEIKLSGPERAALERVEIEDLKRAASEQGWGDIEGDDKDTVVENIGKAMQAKEDKARERMRRVGETGTVAGNLAQLDQMAQNEGSDKALEAGIRRLPEADQGRLTDALGDRERFRQELDAITQEHGLTRVGQVGETVAYDPQKHEVMGDIAPGSPVLITRAGHDFKPGDGSTVNFKARAIPDTGTPIPAKKAAPAKKLTKKAAQAAQDEADIRGLRNLAEGGFQQGPITGKPARRDTQDLLRELINDDNPLSREEVGARIADLDRAQLQEMAKALNIPAGSRRTIPDTRRSIVEATVGRRLDSIAIRGFRGDRPGAPEPDLPEGAPARVLAESHKVTSTPLRLPSVAPKASDPEGPKRHNAELIGAGLDIDRKGEDRQWMDVVQADLDKGIDGRQIADGLRREADTTRTLRNIGDAVGQTSDPGPAGQIERMERMADRLEAVRPIAKPVGQSKLADQGRKDMSTMSAASAQSKAFQDLKAGKSHTEVATALRQAATSVGSRDHDVQPVRVQDFTPAERTAMKRSDAKKLRELAAEIQAQGVAQRAEARAAKKATTPAGKKAAKAQAEFVDRMAGERAAFKGLGDKTPEQDRKDLTGTTGELATAAIDAGLERLQAASTPEQENDAFKGILLPELKTMADRLGLKTTGTKAALMQRIADRVKGREAPTTSAERAVPKAEAPSAGGVNENEPLTNFPHDDNMRMHADSPTMGLAFAYERAGRNGSANRMARLRARTTTPSQGAERLTPQQLVDELRAVRAQETDPRFQQMLDRAIEANDAPMTPLPEIPADTPPLARQLLEDLHAIPYARKGPGSEGGAGLTRGPSLVDQLAEVYRDAGRGERGRERRHPVDRIRAILRNKIHELNDPSFRIWELTSRFESDESSDTGRKVTELEKQIRDWERSHWPK